MKKFVIKEFLDSHDSPISRGIQDMGIIRQGAVRFPKEIGKVYGQDERNPSKCRISQKADKDGRCKTCKNERIAVLYDCISGHALTSTIWLL